MKNKLKITDKLLKVIPGGAHTYSRGYDQFPSNVPEILIRGKGAYVFDNQARRYLDYGMGLRSVNIGYSEPQINRAAIKQILNGNNLTRPSSIELKAASKLVETIKSAEMVKFTKNGSTAVTAAIKLSRAYTKRNLVLRCSNHPFFSYDDWFIGNTVVNRGVPNKIKEMTINFEFNNIKAFKNKIKKFKNKIACVVMEPATDVCPKNIFDNKDCCMNYPCNREFKKKNFIHEVQSICKNEKILFVLDEMITGFRWDLGGAQKVMNLDPDISTFGKAMANGFSVACIAGKKKIMELGSIEKKNQERVFLLSTTHGAEMNGLGAFVETLKFLKAKRVINKNWKFGKKLINEVNNISKNNNLLDKFYFAGPGCSPVFFCKDDNNQINSGFRTLFIQEMLKNRVLMPWVSICFRHADKEMIKTLEAIDKSLFVYKKAIKYGFKRYLKGEAIKPVFRKYN